MRINFTQEHYQLLQKLKREASDALPTIDAAMACGVECEGYRAFLIEYIGQLDEIEKRFMGDMPRESVRGEL